MPVPRLLSGTQGLLTRRDPNAVISVLGGSCLIQELLLCINTHEIRLLF